MPESEKFPDVIKYAFHYSAAGADDPIIRFDNHHGIHELHLVRRSTRPTIRDCRRCIVLGVRHSRSPNELTGNTPIPHP
nr:DUF6516 family protein [Natronorubrum sulfidifaciens]